MKGCFYLQRRFAYLGHALAERLHTTHGMDAACGLTATRSSLAFLQTQSSVPFTSLLLEEDLYAAAQNETLDLSYLESLERDLGVLWSFILADRVVRSGQLLRMYPYDRAPYTHKEMLQIVQVCAKRLSRFLDEEQPDFVLFSVAGNIASLLLFHLARQRGIKTVFIDCARIGTGFFLTETYEASTALWDAWRRIREAPTIEDVARVTEAHAWLTAYRKTPTYYLQSSGANATFQQLRAPQVLQSFLPARFWRSVTGFVRDLVDYMRDSHRGDYDRIKPWWNVWDRLMRSLRLLRGYDDLFEVPVKGERYAYFALHSEPESYPTVFAPFYTDQAWLAACIARSLPVGWKLYIKDHPVMQGSRTRAYYRALRNIPNVRLLSPRIRGLDLAAKAELTLTLTGTAAWEAVLLGRPAIMFGSMFYEPLAAVRRVTDITTLPQTIREHVDTFRDDPEALASFVAALRAQSVDVDLVDLWDVKGGADAAENRARLAPLADLIARFL